MALNPAERELLAVVKYYHNNKKGVVRLVNKLANSFDLTSVSDLTGLSVNEIGDILDSTEKPKPKPRKTKAESIKPDPVIAMVEEPKPNRRKAIHLNAESDLPQRLAHDFSMHINTEMLEGESWLPAKNLMRMFECTTASVTKANKILLEHDWIEPAEPGNFRKGYVVK